MSQKQKIVASLIVRHRDSILLLHRSRHFKELKTGRGEWELPGGAIDFGEKPQDAALRELKEETGISIKDKPKFVKVLSYTIGVQPQTEHRIVLVYRVKLKDAEPIPFLKLSDEHDVFRWVKDSDDLDVMKMPTKLRKILDSYIKTI